MNTELRLDQTITGSNKHGKSAKDNRFTDSEITRHDEMNMLQELNIAKQGMA